VRAVASIDAGQTGRRELARRERASREQLDALDHPEIRRVAHL